MHIVVKVKDSEVYQLNEDGEFICTHESYHINEACCSPFQLGDSGYLECGCGGQDSVSCQNINCTGFTDADLERILQNG
jgi:hypothetical protein